MKKTIFWILGVVIFFLLMVVGLFMSAFIGNAPLEDGKSFGPLTLIKDGFVGVTFIEKGDGKVVLIDAGVDPEAKAIKAFLAKKNYSPKDVETIFITHGHGDHIAGVKAFSEAEIKSLEADRGLAEGTDAGNSLMGKLFGKNKKPIKVTSTFKDEEIFKFGKVTLQAFSVPGHTKGSAVFLVNDTLIFGDTANHKTPDLIKDTPWIFSENTKESHAALIQLEHKLTSRSNEIKHLVFSHSGSLDGFEHFSAFTK